MRFHQLCPILAILFCLTGPVAGHAQSIGKYIWGPPNTDPVRPYLETAKIPHNSQWAHDDWTPQDWVETRGGKPINVINGLYEAQIITDQYTDDDVPVLEVGQAFLDLSTQEKYRVAAFVDSAYGITKKGKGAIMIRFHKRDIPIGIFTKDGLQLQ